MNGWRTDAPALYVPCEIVIASGQIVRGDFIDAETFRSDKFVDYWEWEKWRLVEQSEEE